MLEIITDIIEAEEKAKQIVSEAREKAAKMRADVEEQERQAVAEARSKATETLQQTIAETRDSEDKRFQEALAANEQHRRSFHAKREREIDHAVNRAVDLLRRPLEGA